MRLTFPCADTSTPLLATLLTFAFITAGVRAVPQRDLVFFQTVAEGACIELEQTGGLFFDAPAACQGFHEQPSLYSIEQRLQIQSLRRNLRCHLELTICRRFLHPLDHIV